MAAATETAARDVVFGGLRGRAVQALAFASNGDTWDSGLRTIYSISFTPTTNTAYGFTISNGTVTLVAAAGLTGTMLVLGT